MKFTEYLEKKDVVTEGKTVRCVCAGFFVDGDNRNIGKFKKMLEELITTYGKIISNSMIIGETIVEVQFLHRDFNDNNALKFEREFTHLARSLANKHTYYTI